MPFDISLPELLIILVAALLVFGPKRLPEMGRSLGKGLRDFRNGLAGVEEASSQPDESPGPDATLAAATPPLGEPPDPTEVRSALEALSEEDRRAIVASYGSQPAPQVTTEEHE